MRVVVVGSLNVDVMAQVAYHPRLGETQLASQGKVSPGGKGANQACAAALAGAEVAMVGAVGNDHHAALATELLGRAGVDLTSIVSVDAPTGVALITVTPDGDNAIVVLSGANAKVDLDTVLGPTAPSLDGIVVLQGEVAPEVVDAAAAATVRAGGRVVLNLAPVIAVAADTIRMADPLVVNEHELTAACDLLGIAHTPVGDDLAAWATMTAAEVVAAGVASVIVTLGKEGSVVVTPEATTAIAATPTTAVDTTGAGDAFVGALAAAMADGDDLVSAAGRASAFAATTVARPGAQDSYTDWSSHPTAS